ncbi:hypothetical protein EPN87_03685 [archaeon]|nr:MAG: hypothetical protein EPN87_03685 [archaeon]
MKGLKEDLEKAGIVYNGIIEGSVSNSSADLAKTRGIGIVDKYGMGRGDIDGYEADVILDFTGGYSVEGKDVLYFCGNVPMLKHTRIIGDIEKNPLAGNDIVWASSWEYSPVEIPQIVKAMSEQKATPAEEKLATIKQQ